MCPHAYACSLFAYMCAQVAGSCLLVFIYLFMLSLLLVTFLLSIVPWRWRCCCCRLTKAIHKTASLDEGTTTTKQFAQLFGLLWITSRSSTVYGEAEQSGAADQLAVLKYSQAPIRDDSFVVSRWTRRQNLDGDGKDEAASDDISNRDNNDDDDDDEAGGGNEDTFLLSLKKWRQRQNSFSVLNFCYLGILMLDWLHHLFYYYESREEWRDE